MRKICFTVMVLSSLGFTVLTGCKAPAVGGGDGSLRCRYRTGDVEKVRYHSEREYKNWIEQEANKPEGRNARKDTMTLLMKREVLSVASDGVAEMKVTLEQADIEVDLQLTDTDKPKHYYRSSAAGTDSTWGGMPALAGTSYTLRIAPDTAVVGISPVEGLARKYYSAGKETPVSSVFKEDTIRRIHEHGFVRAAPQTVEPGTTYERVVEIPDPMIKAAALRQHYKVESAGQQVVVSSTGEAVLQRPEGFPEPSLPNDFGSMLREASDMQELKVTGQGAFAAQTGRVLRDETKVYAYLVMLEEVFFAGTEGFQKSETGGKGGGAMMTEVFFESAFESLP